MVGCYVEDVFARVAESQRWFVLPGHKDAPPVGFAADGALDGTSGVRVGIMAPTELDLGGHSGLNLHLRMVGDARL